MRLLVYWHTLRHLKAIQLFYLVRRRLLNRGGPALALWRATPAAGYQLTPRLPAPPPLEDDRLVFLNQPAPFPVSAIDWSSTAMPKLWRYNLHYLDVLGAQTLNLQVRGELLDDWIDGNVRRGLSADAWEPYPVSLRIINWLFWLQEWTAAGFTVPALWWDALFLHGRILADALEYQIQANHLFKNLVALLMISYAFQGSLARRWRQVAVKGLRRELHAQFLPDGGHYERSPMYHCILLEQTLHLLNLFKNNDPNHPLRVSVTDVTRRGLRWLSTITAPDGTIPLLNDSAHGIAPNLDTLKRYASRLELPEIKSAPPEIIALPDTGLYGFRFGDDLCLFDCGDIGPTFQPGHTHCDMLSILLFVGGEPVLIDTGVHDYEDSPERYLARRTASHNTLTIDGKDQSQIWGQFRVGRRARVTEADLQSVADGVLITGAHDGYRCLHGKPLHRRTVQCSGRVWSIVDEVNGREVHDVDIFWHLDWGCSVVLDEAANQALVNRKGKPVVRFTFEGDARIQLGLSRGWVFPEFGIRRAHDVVTVACIGAPLPLRVVTTIERLDGDPKEESGTRTIVPVEEMEFGNRSAITK